MDDEQRHLLAKRSIDKFLRRLLGSLTLVGALYLLFGSYLLDQGCENVCDGTGWLLFVAALGIVPAGLALVEAIRNRVGAFALWLIAALAVYGI